MQTQKTLEMAAALLKPWAMETTTPEPNRMDVVVDAAHVVVASRMLHSPDWGYLATITGLDLGEEQQLIEVLYHFCAGEAVVTLRVRLPRHKAVVSSLCDVIPSASFFEQELSEMLGVTVEGIVTPEHLYLPDDWPEGTYPLRKDFTAHSSAP
jgi:Ni,Fe-hydrogenase III component G